MPRSMGERLRGYRAQASAFLRENAQLAYLRLAHGARCFEFQGERYPYFYHRYNITWTNERAVEVPIVWRVVSSSRRKRILEVGNVLQHYFPVAHDIVDKYDPSPGLIRADVVDFRSPEPYDVIVSISTLEHVGWDEQPRDPEKVVAAVDNLVSLLAPGGKLIATMPLGYNPNLDGLLATDRLKFSRTGFLKRISPDNLWREVPWEEVESARYDQPYTCANVLLVASIDRDGVSGV